MHGKLFTLVMALALVVAACSGGSVQTPTGVPPSPATISVTLTDALQIEPPQMSAPLGVPVTFVVTNTGEVEHEFYVGDESAQNEHGEEMQSMGGMAHDEPNGISLEPGETKQLTITFAERGVTLAGCHLPGHYPGGMRATITVD